MKNESKETSRYFFLEEGGELGRLTREYPWSETPLGPVETWPSPLRTMVGVVLNSEFPMVLWWGEELIQFYNDAFRRSLGENGKHPHALGQSAEESWPETWENISPYIDQVKQSNKSIFLEDQLLPIYRNGKIEDVYWTYSFSSVLGESGQVEGVLVVCTETTRKVNALRKIKTTKEELEAGEKNLRNIILQAPVAMCIFKGRNHVVEIANDRMIQLWGRPHADILNKPIFDGLPEARNQGFEEILERVFTTGKTHKAYGVPISLPRDKDLKIVYVNYVFEAFYDPSGNITGVMGVAVDVTEEAHARRELEKSENLLRSIVESAPFPIGVYSGREMRIELVNQAIIDVWGKGSDIVGKLYSEVLPELESQEIYPQLEGVYTTGIPFHARNQRVDLEVDGKLQIFYFNYSFTPLFDMEGKVFGIMNTAADVTDLNLAKQKVEQSEQNFRNMVKQAPVAMCIMIGPEHSVEVANDLFLGLWGKTEEEVLNKPIFKGLPQTDILPQETLLSKVYNEGKSYTATEMPVTYLRDGKKVNGYQNFVYEPYRDSSGEILGILTIAIDVTDQVIARRKIEEVVAERTRDLQKSNAELTQFAYITSHDLQEPARKIRIFSEMLENSLEEQQSEKPISYIRKIENSAERMLTLIRDILSFSQLSKAERQFTRVDLNEILRETVDDFELLIEQKKCEVESDPLPEIEAIPVQMRQLFTNLVSNALKFSKENKPLKIRITAEEKTPDDLQRYGNLRKAPSYLYMVFSDNGIGFNQENSEQIFEIFQRLHARSDYHGTGIGLAMCKKIVENHGGHIFAIAAPEEGASFNIILPLKQQD